jgi:hypothetical protein
MSASLAAAKKRRAPPSAQSSSNPSPQPQTTNPSMLQGNPAGLTLPQVIQLVDKRLLQLEHAVVKLNNAQLHSPENSTESVPSNINEVLDVLTARINEIGEEVYTLKDTVLSLQTYTMDVNKMLIEERVRLLGGTDPRHEDTPLEQILNA